MKISVQDFAEVVAELRDAANDTSAQEKRRAVRMEVTAKLTIGLLKDNQVVRTFGALSRDISLNGVGLLQSVAPQSGQEFVIGLPRKTPKTPLFFVTTVVHCRPLADGVYGLGCEFVRKATTEMAGKLSHDQDSEHDRIRKSVLS